MKKNNNKGKIIILIICIALIGLLLVKNYFDNKIPSIYYRTYTKENGWSKWVKDGKTSGDKKTNIQNIQIKVKNNTDVIYSLYTDDWSNSYNVSSKIKNKDIKGIKISLMDKLYKKYDIYYRTYNSDNEWLEWSSDYLISGNKNKTINAIEIKIIPKNVIRYDNLKEYNQSKYGENIGF